MGVFLYFQELTMGIRTGKRRFMTRERSDMEDKNWDLLEEADWHFRKVVRRFVKERDKISVEGISLPGLLILNTIFRNGAEAWRAGGTTRLHIRAVTAICDKLETSGFAIRRRSKTDRRAIALDITEAGRDLCGVMKMLAGI